MSKVARDYIENTRPAKQGQLRKADEVENRTAKVLLCSLGSVAPVSLSDLAKRVQHVHVAKIRALRKDEQTAHGKHGR